MSSPVFKFCTCRHHDERACGELRRPDLAKDWTVRCKCQCHALAVELLAEDRRQEELLAGSIVEDFERQERGAA